MATQILAVFDFNQNELRNTRVQNLATAPGSPVVGQPYFDTVLGHGRIWDGTVWQRWGFTNLNDIPAPDAAYDFGGVEITGVGTPTADTSAATKLYVDNAIAGFDWKDSVVAATDADITLSGPQTIDGVGVVAEDRVLVKEQTTAEENGIYVVKAGAWTRAADMNANDEVVSASVFVEQGTLYADSGWVVTSDSPFTLGTTDMDWVQFSGTGQISAGAGMTKTGNTLDVVAGDGILVAADSVAADFSDTDPLADGTADPGVATQMSRDDHVHPGAAGTVQTYSTTLSGDDSTTAFVVTHSLATKNVQVQVFDTNGAFDLVHTDVERTTTNAVTIRFAVAPATASDYRVVVNG
jgi:hypothetical protein